MTGLKDLTGQKFGRLTVIERTYSDKIKTKEALWLCKCDCGNTTIVRSYLLRKGITTSCGCYNKEITVKRSKTHGMSNSKLYRVYRGILNRCYNPKVPEFKNYGARGIKVCDEWLNSFEKFSDWAIENGYDETAKRGKCTIDRINPDGNYEPTNCRWVDIKKQARNKRSNHLVTYKGETLCIAEWAEILKINYDFLKYHLRKGKTIEEILYIY